MNTFIYYANISSSRKKKRSSKKKCNFQKLIKQKIRKRASRDTDALPIVYLIKYILLIRCAFIDVAFVNTLKTLSNKKQTVYLITV